MSKRVSFHHEGHRYQPGLAGICVCLRCQRSRLARRKVYSAAYHRAKKNRGGRDK
jgi:hypothetical protein